ncbi:2-dehydropantoate 2-reductase [Pseudomaricurvus alkylphenolicus]|jgi:2-dehydropantoate 2-reductase|uniref:2-dehydropantoate 2-reductase n=1 Tax=Pseudomaricurvus alkylphenolicus TaxID=1306991 RepID=UPI001420C980|nr:2-dehydropantoate 2-reductase [Pseudomaricurvus alkylphenolicus]NIB40477.1 2-dehydropantoate 2-reductase [Pseudomaricurvus alkylphenolicus]
MVKIAVLGAGSIGCYVGGCLAAGRARVTLIGRPRIQQQLQAHGLHVTDWRGRDAQVPWSNFQFSLSNDVLADTDFVLVTVKSGDTESAALLMASALNPKAVVVSLQNGVRNTEVLRRCLPDHKVLKGMVPFNVVSAGGGHFHCGTEGELMIEADPSASALVEALQRADLPTVMSDDLEGIQWGKLLMNLNNSVNALSGIPLKEQLNRGEFRRITAMSQREALGLLKQAGITPAKVGKVGPGVIPFLLCLPDWIFRRIAGSMIKIDPKARSSMYEDLALGRRTEIDFLNGEIVQLAEALGRSAPVNQAIVDLVRQAEQSQSGSPNYPAADLFRRVTSGPV